MQALCTALYTKMVGDTGTGGVAQLATGGIHDVLAPDEAAHPFLTYQQVNAPRQYTFTQLATIPFTFLMTAFDEGLDWTRNRAIIERLEFLLTDSTDWNVPGYRVTKVRVANSLDTEETLDGVDFPVTKTWVDITLAKVN